MSALEITLSNIKEKAQELNEKELSFSPSAQNEMALLDAALEQILALTNEGV